MTKALIIDEDIDVCIAIHDYLINNNDDIIVDYESQWNESSYDEYNLNDYDVILCNLDLEGLVFSIQNSKQKGINININNPHYYYYHYYYYYYYYHDYHYHYYHHHHYYYYYYNCCCCYYYHHNHYY
jgi:hypothetical protein